MAPMSIFASTPTCFLLFPNLSLTQASYAFVVICSCSDSLFSICGNKCLYQQTHHRCSAVYMLHRLFFFLWCLGTVVVVLVFILLFLPFSLMQPSFLHFSLFLAILIMCVLVGFIGVQITSGFISLILLGLTQQSSFFLSFSSLCQLKVYAKSKKIDQDGFLSHTVVFTLLYRKNVPTHQPLGDIVKVCL